MRPEECKNLTMQDCELVILRSAIDRAEKIQKSKLVNSPEVKKIMSIVEEFIRKKKLLVYGGTAINNILPKKAQFYDPYTDIPDYDFYSHNALSDSKELADVYFNNGFSEVEAKAGQHHGTFKVFVNFIPVADITQMHQQLFSMLKTDSIAISGIHYVPANFLRMSMYLELSRPKGNVERWEKVHKRLALLNKYYPLKSTNCSKINFQRRISNVVPNDKTTDKSTVSLNSFRSDKSLKSGQSPKHSSFARADQRYL